MSFAHADTGSIQNVDFIAPDGRRYACWPFDAGTRVWYYVYVISPPIPESDAQWLYGSINGLSLKFEVTHTNGSQWTAQDSFPLNWPKPPHFVRPEAGNKIFANDERIVFVLPEPGPPLIGEDLYADETIGASVSHFDAGYWGEVSYWPLLTVNYPDYWWGLALPTAGGEGLSAPLEEHETYSFIAAREWTRHFYGEEGDKYEYGGFTARSETWIPVRTGEECIEPSWKSGLTYGFSGASSGSWYDPVPADAFIFEITSGGNTFTSIEDFPEGFSDEFEVTVDGTSLGLFSPGTPCPFTNAYPGGVTNFMISKILPTVDGDDPHAFPVKLSFNTEPADFTMTATGNAAVATLYSEWEEENFEPAWRTNRALVGFAADPDGDGVRNWDEFLAGTSATNDKSRLMLEHLSVSQAVMRVTVGHTRSNRSYKLFHTSDLATGTWSSVTSSRLGSPGSTVIDAPPSAQGAGFFKAEASIDGPE